MENTIINLIEHAKETEDCIVMLEIRDLLYHITNTDNVPINWRYIGERIERRYKKDTWVYEKLGLWDYTD